jgi:starvation-inducible DNA-binding protein
MVKTNLKTVEHKVQLGIGAENREVIADNLSKLLADQHVLYVKTRNFHWNVQGMAFGPLHALFQEQYTAMATHIDDTAERIRSLGYFATGSMAAFLENTRLTEADAQGGNAQEMVSILCRDHEAIIRTLRGDIETAEQGKDVGTADFLTMLLEFHEKTAWMLRAHLA